MLLISKLYIHVVISNMFHFIVNYANSPKHCLNNQNCYKLFLRIIENMYNIFFFKSSFFKYLDGNCMYLYKSWIVDQIFYFISRRNKYWRACRQTLLKLNMIELTIFVLLTSRNIFFIIRIHVCIYRKLTCCINHAIFWTNIQAICIV